MKVLHCSLTTKKTPLAAPLYLHPTPKVLPALSQSYFPSLQICHFKNDILIHISVNQNSCVEGLWVYSLLLLRNKLIMNIHIQDFVYSCVLRWMPKSEPFRLYGKGKFSFIRTFQTVFPGWLFCFIFSSAVCERSTCSSCLPMFVIVIFYFSYSNRYAVILYCSFNLHFPNG